MAGVALVLGGGNSFFALQRVDEGWTRWIPSTALVWIVPASAPQLSTDLGMALNCRSSSLWSWQGAIITARQIWLADDGDLSASALTRSRWIEGAPIRIESVAPSRLIPFVGGWVVDVTSTAGPPLHLTSDPSAFDPMATSCFFGRTSAQESVVWPGMPVGEVDVPLIIQIDGPFGVSRTVKRNLRFSVVPTDQRVLNPVRSPELATVIESSLRISAKPGDVPSIDVQVLPNEVRKSLTSASGTHPPAVGLCIEICDRGRVVARFDQLAGESFGWGRAGPLDELREIAADPDGTLLKPEVLARLVVRVRGDQGVSMQDLFATDYWSGEFTIPLAEVLDRQIPYGF